MRPISCRGVKEVRERCRQKCEEQESTASGLHCVDIIVSDAVGIHLGTVKEGTPVLGTLKLIIHQLQ